MPSLVNSLVVQWLGLHALTAEGLSSIPDHGTKIPQASWCGQKKKKATRRMPSPLCISHLFICSTHTFTKPTSLHTTRMEPRLLSFHSIKLPCSPPAQKAASNCTLACHQQEPPGLSLRSKVNWLVWAVPRAWYLDLPNDLDEIIQFPGLCRFLKSPAIQFSSVAQSCPTLRPHEPQHARPPCPSPTPGVYPNPCPSSR